MTRRSRVRIPGQLIVRAYAPVRRRLLLALLVAAALLALCLVYELGRYQAGQAARRANAQRDALMQQIQQLQDTQRQLRVQLAAADEGRVAQLRERAEVAKTIGDLQAQVARQQQQVEFYRGMMPQTGVDATTTVRVQQFHIAALKGAQQYALRFVLNRLVKPEETFSGTVGITIDGTRKASAASLNLGTLSGGKRAVLPVSFRYYSQIEQDITLPADFKPERVTLEVRPARAGMAPYRQTFAWNVEPA